MTAPLGICADNGSAEHVLAATESLKRSRNSLSFEKNRFETALRDYRINACVSSHD